MSLSRYQAWFNLLKWFTWYRKKRYLRCRLDAASNECDSTGHGGRQRKTRVSFRGYPWFKAMNLDGVERIYGIQVSDIETWTPSGTNMKLLAERGVTVFFTQVFRDSFSMQTCTQVTYSFNPENQITRSGLKRIVALSARLTAKISAIWPKPIGFL